MDSECLTSGVTLSMLRLVSELRLTPNLVMIQAGLVEGWFGLVDDSVESHWCCTAARLGRGHEKTWGLREFSG